jgi:hypothetical protein
MKKLITSVVLLFGGLMLAGSLLSLNSCSKGDVLAPDTVYIYKDTCGCEGTNIIENSNFNTPLTGTTDLDNSNCQPWYPVSGTPQIATSFGQDSVRGFIQAWGNRDEHEATGQTLKTPIKAGDKFTLKMDILFFHDNLNNYPTYVTIRVNAVNSSNGKSTTIALFSNLTDQNWKTYQSSWTSDGDYDQIVFAPENEYYGDPYSVSWTRIDNLKLLKQ